MKNYFVLMLVVGLMLGGCEKEKVSAPEPQPTEQAKPTIVEQVKESANNVVEQATEVVDSAAQMVKDSGVATEQAVKEVVATAAEDVSAVAEVVEQKAEAIVDAAEQQVADVKQEGAQLVNNLVDSAVAVPEVPALQASQTVVFECDKGNVTLAHAQHGEEYGCPSCHGASAPGPLELGKTKAHTLCKTCHKAKKAGPTSCSGCHKK
ncbi:MAG: hypothetical protein J7K75_13020 [Desulfuromonas sp.]|nr:hypothetical protein [Desulfuromonas sp.]